MSKGFPAIRSPLQFLLTAKHWSIDYAVNIKIDSTLYHIYYRERGLIRLSFCPLLVIYIFLFNPLFKVLAYLA